MKVDSPRDRLLRYDLRIAINTVRNAFARWHDRVIAAIMLLAGTGAVRASFTGQSWATGAWMAIGAGIIVGASAGQVVARRIAFHGFDGVLATDALCPVTRRRYAAAWHGIGMAALAMIMVIARPSLLIIALLGYVGGMLATVLARSLGLQKTAAGSARRQWDLRSRLRRPIAGMMAAAIMLLSMSVRPVVGPMAGMAICGLLALLLAASLTTVDDAVVRYMTVVGHGVLSIAVHHARSMAWFVALAVPGCWLVAGPVAAGITASASVAMLFLVSLRILAYRLYGRRFANLLVAVLLGLPLLAGYALPLFAPVVAITILWRLHRRSRATTWMLP